MISEPLQGNRYFIIKSQITKKDWAYFVRYIAEQLYSIAKKHFGS